MFQALKHETEEEIYSNFIDSLKSQKTKEIYDNSLKAFMKFHNIEGYSQLLETPTINIEQKIKAYILESVNKELSTSFKQIFMSAAKHFFEMNDIENIKWRKLKRFMGEETPKHEDRRYTHEEIQTLLNASNLKLKMAILLMSSGGLRLGSLPTILVSHLKRIESGSGPVYKISVYKGLKGKGQYYTFCTPECVTAIDNYLQFRERVGEKIRGDSPLLRKDFDVSFHEKARNQVISSTYHSIRIAIYTCLVNTGIRVRDPVNIRNRNEVKMTHGFRKFFETMLVNANIHETIIRKLTGHSDNSNLTQLYSKQTEEEMLSEYEKAIDALTINPENRLRRKVEKLEVERTEIQALALELDKIKKATGIN